MSRTATVSITITHKDGHQSTIESPLQGNTHAKDSQPYFEIRTRYYLWLKGTKEGQSVIYRPSPKHTPYLTFHATPAKRKP